VSATELCPYWWPTYPWKGRSETGLARWELQPFVVLVSLELLPFVVLLSLELQPFVLLVSIELLPFVVLLALEFQPFVVLYVTRVTALFALLTVKSYCPMLYCCQWQVTALCCFVDSEELLPFVVLLTVKSYCPWLHGWKWRVTTLWYISMFSLQLYVDARLKLEVAYYNERQSVWEPLVEPVLTDGKLKKWELQCEVSYSLTYWFTY